MNHIEFREAFQKIISHNAQMRLIQEKLKEVTRWDKNGSHEKWIKLYYDQNKELKENFKKMLCGRSLDEWRRHSQLISNIKSRMNGSRDENNKLNHKRRLEALQFELKTPKP